MGLDITAYRKLTPKPEVDYYGKDTDPYFYARFDQDTIDCVQKFWPGHCDGLKAGVFSFAEQHEFRAGSYSGYNYWRDWLAGISGWGDAEQCWNSDKTEGPFYELINFSDCEGVIGPKVAAKLARDFAGFENSSRTHGAPSGFSRAIQVHVLPRTISSLAKGV